MAFLGAFMKNKSLGVFFLSFYYKHFQPFSKAEHSKPLCTHTASGSMHHPGFAIPVPFALLSLFFEFLFVCLLLENSEANT